MTYVVTNTGNVPLPFPILTAADAPVARVGETRIIVVNNLTGGDHNFHLHGFVMQPIETQYIDLDNPANNETVPAPYLENKDTVYVPRRRGAKGRSRNIVRLAVKIDDTGREGRITASGKTPTATTSGGWAFHCHIDEHAARGMLAFLQVVD